ncbi:MULTISPECIES: hypothetical protein [unclassified Streptomyces]|nr:MULTISPECIES: hypothetical protein [unclassified Streptomyces]WSA92673.1 hypothetical protein OIE63_14715 [Streptomyces sp. NBC_01795]WSB77039.1 hypothetical protein OHB04_15520 [Streptomyces sp. NBC_01775]WSS14689.1 hypothetical protein OG533_24425 [Streptomyces sp. NBC_01186]WSS43519.1 hypothetical protein OG220_25175 [Streptomyces sp. NBC_01187]
MLTAWPARSSYGPRTGLESLDRRLEVLDRRLERDGRQAAREPGPGVR